MEEKPCLCQGSEVRVDRQIGHYGKATGNLKTIGYNQILHHLQISVLSLRDPPTILWPFLHKIKPNWANWTLESLESINDLSDNQHLLLLSILTDSLFATIFVVLTGQATNFFLKATSASSVPFFFFFLIIMTFNLNTHLLNPHRVCVPWMQWMQISAPR